MSASKEENIRRLILGTAQFGLDYGISNQRGQIPQTEVQAILAAAHTAGVRTLDTAAAYGTSETSIGQALSNSPGNFRIISKYPPKTTGTSIRQDLDASLAKLGVEKLHAYLLHSYSTYAAKPTILGELQELKATGLVEKVGISLYHPTEAEELLEREAAIDIVQFPYSVFDRRFEKVIPHLREKGIETHVRSVYLQGLYFMQPGKIPEGLQGAAPKVAKLQQLAKEHNLPLGALLLGFVLTNPQITNIVLGVESLQTLQENISYCSIGLSEALLCELQKYSEEDENIILPYNWAKP